MSRLGTTVLIVTIITLTLCSTALAAEITANPENVYLAPGGQNKTVLTVTVDSPSVVYITYEITKYKEYIDARLTDLNGNPLTDWGDKYT